MTPMCDIDTGFVVGWAVATVSCDGSDITISYYDSVGELVGTVLPGTWGICRPGFNSQSVNQIIQLTQDEYDALVSKDPNTLYIIVEPEGS